jgi:hypothetical protein
MAVIVSNYLKVKILNGEVQLKNHDIRLLLVTSSFNGTAAHEFISSIPVLGELTGAGYVRKQLLNRQINLDLANNRAEFDADDITWVGINAGVAAGFVLYRYVTNDADSPFILYSSEGGFPFSTNGGDLTITFSLEGVIQQLAA